MQTTLVNFIMPIGMIAIFYFLLIRPQQKKDKQLKEMRSSLKVGDEQPHNSIQDLMKFMI